MSFFNQYFFKERATTLLLFLLLAEVSACSSSAQSNIVATVNNEPITKTELYYFMLLNKADVYNRLYQKYNVSFTKGFWQKKIHGKTPLNLLKKKALNDAIRYKTEQILAQNKGIKLETNFDSLMLKRKRLNKQRKKAVKNGQVIYGPVSLTPRNFISKTRDKMVKKTKDILSKDEFKISEKKMDRMYSVYKSNGHLKSKNNSDYQSFKNIKQKQYTDEKYNKLVQKMTGEVIVHLDKDMYKKIKLN